MTTVLSDLLASIRRSRPTVAEDEVTWIREFRDTAPELAAYAERCFLECLSLRANQAEIEEAQARIRSEIESLTAPEWHSVVITHVNRNEPLSVEVASRQVGRLQVSVHPDVPAESLSVGRRGLLTRQRNCLFKVDSRELECTAVGSFDRRLDKHHALLEFRGDLVPVVLAGELPETELVKGDLIGFDLEVSNIAFLRHSKPEGHEFFETSVPQDDFSQLGGLDEVVRRMKRAVEWRVVHGDIANKYGLRRRGSILLSGPPGNGKTKLVRCLANYLGQLRPDHPVQFMSVVASQDHSEWFGRSERNLRDRFDAAREAARHGQVLMFFDEFDAIAVRRGADWGHTAADRILNTLLALLDGVQQNENLLVVAATNRADTLDPALVRPGRLNQKIWIGPPNRTAARAILRRYLVAERPLAAGFDPELVTESILSRLYSPNGSLSQLGQVKLADNRVLPIRGRELISGAILEGMVSEAAENAAEREILGGEPGLGETDLCDAIESELGSLLNLLTPGNVKSYLPSIPQDARPVSVETRALMSGSSH